MAENDDKSTQEPAESAGSQEAAQEALEFVQWLSEQPKAVQQAYEEHTGSLKKALEAERAKAKEGTKASKRLAELEAKRKEAEEAELSEIERLQKALAERDAKLTKIQTEALKKQIAAEVGLPEALALRIQGDDEEAMREDAKSILEALPKTEEPADEPADEQPKRKAPRLQSTNPLSGLPAGETREQAKARIYGGKVNIFDPNRNAQRGGGVIFNAPADDEG